MTTENNETCGNCRFCIEQKGDPQQQGIGSTVLNCFRYPPLANGFPLGAPGGGIGGVMNMTATPQVDAKRDACGEWQPKTTN